MPILSRTQDISCPEWTIAPKRISYLVKYHELHGDFLYQQKRPQFVRNVAKQRYPLFEQRDLRRKRIHHLENRHSDTKSQSSLSKYKLDSREDRHLYPSIDNYPRELDDSDRLDSPANLNWNKNDLLLYYGIGIHFFLLCVHVSFFRLKKKEKSGSDYLVMFWLVTVTHKSYQVNRCNAISAAKGTRSTMMHQVKITG